MSNDTKKWIAGVAMAVVAGLILWLITTSLESCGKYPTPTPPPSPSLPPITSPTPMLTPTSPSPTSTLTPTPVSPSPTPVNDETSKSLFDLERLGRGNRTIEVWSLNPKALEDLRGNEYETAYTCKLSDAVIKLNYWYEGANYREYFLDEKYNSFSGTIFLPKGYTLGNVTAILAIYGIDKEGETTLINAIEFDRNDISIDFTEEITGYMSIRLEWYRSAPNGTSWLSVGEAYVAIVNFIVSE